MAPQLHGQSCHHRHAPTPTSSLFSLSLKLMSLVRPPSSSSCRRRHGSTSSSLRRSEGSCICISRHKRHAPRSSNTPSNRWIDARVGEHPRADHYGCRGSIFAGKTKARHEAEVSAQLIFRFPSLHQQVSFHSFLCGCELGCFSFPWRLWMMKALKPGNHFWSVRFSF